MVMMVMTHMDKDVIMYNSIAFYFMYVYRSIPCRLGIRVISPTPPMHESNGETAEPERSASPMLSCSSAPTAQTPAAAASKTTTSSNDQPRAPNRAHPRERLTE